MKENKLGKFQVFFFLIIVLMVEALVVYYGYAIHHIRLEDNIYLMYGITGIMLSVFIYFATFFSEGKWMIFFRNFVVLILTMTSLITVVLLKIEIDTIKVPQGLSQEYIESKFKAYEENLQQLQAQNSELKRYVDIQKSELIQELEINRRAIHAQQDIIKKNAGEIESGKKYQIIKNPF